MTAAAKPFPHEEIAAEELRREQADKAPAVVLVPPAAPAAGDYRASVALSLLTAKAARGDALDAVAVSACVEAAGDLIAALAR